MGDKITEVLCEKTTIDSDAALITHEGGSISKIVPQPNAESCEKKLSIADTKEDTPTTTASSAQDISGAGLFSDIESSDNSIGYDSSDVLKSLNASTVLEAGVCEDKKVIESEFDPVESDEEFFEDPPLAEATQHLSENNTTDEEQPCKSEDVNETLDEEEKTPTPLAVEEIAECSVFYSHEEVVTEITVATEEEGDLLKNIELETPTVADNACVVQTVTDQVPEQEGSDCTIDDQIIKEKATSDVLADKIPTQLDKELSDDSKATAEPTKDENFVLELPVLEKEKEVLIQSNPEVDVSKSSTPDSKPPTEDQSEKSEEMSTTDIEPSEDLQLMQERTDDNEKVTLKSPLVESEEVLSTDLPEGMETSDEPTVVDELTKVEEMKDIVLQLETKNSSSETEVPIELEKTFMETEDVSKDPINEEIESEKNEVDQEIPMDGDIECEDKVLKSNEVSEENVEAVCLVENIGNNEDLSEADTKSEELPQIDKKLDCDENNSKEHSKENCKTSIEIEKTDGKDEKNKVDISNDSEKLEKLPIIDAEETTTQPSVMISTESNVKEKVMEDDESKKNEIPDDESAEVIESSEKSKEEKDSQESVPDVDTKSPEETLNSPDDQEEKKHSETAKIIHVFENLEQELETSETPGEQKTSSTEKEQSSEDKVELIESSMKETEPLNASNQVDKVVIGAGEIPSENTEEVVETSILLNEQDKLSSDLAKSVDEDENQAEQNLLLSKETKATSIEKIQQVNNRQKLVEQLIGKIETLEKILQTSTMDSSEKTLEILESVTVSIEKEDLSNESEEEANKTEVIEDPITSKLAAIVDIPEMVVEVVEEKVMKPQDAPSPIVAQDSKKPDTQICFDIIEIDDDDDDLEEKTNLESSSMKEGEPTSEKKVEETTATVETPQQEYKEIITTTNEELSEQNKEKPEEKSKEEKAAIQESSGKDNDDDDQSLLVIDTSHKEDNDNESNYMDNETATSAPSTDSSSDGSLEVFYDKECINYECKRESKSFYRATLFTLSFFKISKKRSKIQFVCEDCYDRALRSYEDLCKTLKQKQPLLYGTSFKSQEFVEIIDSSDEEESDAGVDKPKVSDENALPKESIEMLEAELEGAIRKVMQNVDIQNQLSWTKQILTQRLNNMQEDTDFISDQLRALQKKADNMHNSLYQCPKIKLRQLTPLDLNSGRMYNPESDNSTSSIPPPGEIVRPPIRLNEEYYAVKAKAIASWVPCKVIEETDSYSSNYNQMKTYKIKFTKLTRYPMFKTVYAKHMAYFDPPNVRLPIGSRVIAYFDVTSLSRGKEKMLIPSAFYPGIIAEPLKQSNKFRYLVFYDDGYFQYVNHKDVRLVCQASENVWEDVHHQSREFIHNYLTQYAVNRPMVQTQKGQSMLVDYNGKWIYARVIDVDCSLVRMLFEGQNRSEWIYRGSTRLGPVYKESNNLSQKNTLNATRRRTEPFIRYINGDDTSSQQVQEAAEAQQRTAGGNETRAVAKKSVSRVDSLNNNNSTAANIAQAVPTVRHLNNSTIFVDDDNKPKGKVVYYTARKNLPPRNYVPHICNPSCPFNVTHNLAFYSPLAKPLLSGWERQVFRQKSKKMIVYRGPCGKRMRTIEELHRYLRVTDNELNVDNFDFSPDTNCLAEYVLEKCLVNKKDISCGKEKMPIPCVNYYDDTMPPACEYSAERIPTAGVPLNLDEEFMCGCDCEDDCSDKSRCACWELTYAGAKYGMPSVPTEMVGYQYKRLYEHVPTGIYECNSRCKCKANCVNRVVQQPLQSKLQVFKTSNRGWGLRCINDVPRGSFICVYAGQLLTEQVANEGGLDAGDEYFAELDYIEVAEQIKEGYESDVQEPDDEEEFYNPDRDDDDFDFRAPSELGKDKEFTTRLRARRGTKNSTDSEFDSQERQVISFEPNKTMDTSNEPNEKPTIRKLFGRDESCYVMDAKVRGNLGRYFNHSCSPNLFVQNVFVDTHDLRFPWVAFFASTHIRAGTELTWNYNYEVGVVPGKVLYCQCGAPNCRQRLL